MLSFCVISRHVVKASVPYKMALYMALQCHIKLMERGRSPKVTDK